MKTICYTYQDFTPEKKAGGRGGKKAGGRGKKKVNLVDTLFMQHFGDIIVGLRLTVPHFLFYLLSSAMWQKASSNSDSDSGSGSEKKVADSDSEDEKPRPALSGSESQSGSKSESDSDPPPKKGPQGRKKGACANSLQTDQLHPKCLSVFLLSAFVCSHPQKSLHQSHVHGNPNPPPPNEHLHHPPTATGQTFF